MARRPSLTPRQKQLKRLQKQVQQVENDVHCAYAVMDKQYGKMLNYRQLMRHPEYKCEWDLS